MNWIMVRRSVITSIAIVSCLEARAECYNDQFVGNIDGGFLVNCPDTSPLPAFAFSLAQPDTTNSGAIDLACEYQGAPAPPRGWCNADAGRAGDGHATLFIDWGRYSGVPGCPNPAGYGNGAGRLFLVVAAANGSSMISSIGYSDEEYGYALEQSQLWDGQQLTPLRCDTASSTIRLDSVTSSGGEVHAEVSTFVPAIHTDCDPGTYGQLLGTCPGGPSSIPTLSRGRIYATTGACPEDGGTVDLRRSGWSLVADPDEQGHASLVLPAPAGSSCLYVGATFAFGGVESPAIGGFVRFPQPACVDTDFDGVTDCAGDCNDNDPEVYAGHNEVCNGIDDDCDGQIDEGDVCSQTCSAPGKIGNDVRVTTDPAASAFPVMVANGQGYGVAWLDSRDQANNYQLYFARLDANGSKIGTENRISSTGTASYNSFGLVWTGSEYGAAWTDYQDNSAVVRFARIDAQGNKIGTDARVASGSETVFDTIFPALAWSGADYGLVYRELSALRFSRVDPLGLTIGTSVGITAQSGSYNDRRSSLVWNGSDYGFAWIRSYSGMVRVFFERLNTAGARIASELAVSDFYGTYGNEPDVRLVWTGTEYGMVWAIPDSGSTNLYFRRLSPTGVKLGPDRLIASSPFGIVSFSPIWTGAEYALAWNERSGATFKLKLTRFDVTGTSSGPALVVTADGSPWDPSLHWNGTGFDLAFRAYRNDNSDIYFARTGCDCVDADGDGFTSCNECDDTRADVHPGAIEECNGRDDDCNGLVDEGLGLTSCGVGACARTMSSCFRGLAQSCTPFAPTSERWNGIDDNCNGVVDDTPSASIVLRFSDHVSLAWDHEVGFDSFNVYRGSLAVLRSGGSYTQDPATTPLALRACGVSVASFTDSMDPPSLEAVFYLVAGVQNGVETDLGIDTAGRVQFSANACP